MGRKRVVGAFRNAQLGITTAVACAEHCVDCTIFMDSEEIEKHYDCVEVIKKFGAQVKSVEGDDLDKVFLTASREWTLVTAEESQRNFERSSYLMGTVVRPHPDPDMIITGKETIIQEREKLGSTPRVVLKCLGSASTASAGHEFIQEEDVRWIIVIRTPETFQHEVNMVTDSEGVKACNLVVTLEGIYPSMDSSCAFAYLDQLCHTLPDGYKVLVVRNC